MEGMGMEDSKKEKGWYLELMAPNVKGSRYAWLDPSAIYMDSEAYLSCINDLCTPFDAKQIDIVAGVDATGFILGGGIAHHLSKGFLAIRKVGKLCVEVNSESYEDYQSQIKTLEVRKNPFPPGSRVLLVDQWIETGGTMTAATKLVEAAQGVIIGICSIAVENHHEMARKLTKKYKVSHCVPSKMWQQQINEHYLESFKSRYNITREQFYKMQSFTKI